MERPSPRTALKGPRRACRQCRVVHLTPWASMPRMDLVMEWTEPGQTILTYDTLEPIGDMVVHFLCHGFRQVAKETGAFSE